MASRMIFAVAGSGKTAYLVDQLNEASRALVITYTNNNYDNIRTRIIRKFGCVPNNITLFTYFRFLYTFCFMPFLQLSQNTKGVNFNPPPPLHRFARGRARYVDSGNRLYSNRIAKFLEEQSVIVDVKARLNKYFDRILIDEVQDIAGHDFNLLMATVDAGPEIILVGDYFQHTFDTGRDGNVNQNIHRDFAQYKSRCERAGLAVETNFLGKSYRCSSSICSFITEKLGIAIQSCRSDRTNITFVSSQVAADAIFADNQIVKLFYQESSKYLCRGDNWGAVKGIDNFERVCVVLNNTTSRAYKKHDLASLPSVTKNKLYVAITRARGDLYFVPEEFYIGHKMH